MLKTVNVWSVDNVETLKDCFMCTDWEVFTQDNPDINTATDSVTDYIKFCTETVIPKKTEMFSQQETLHNQGDQRLHT